jgi:phosphoribosyl 1,2-cyclic phosphodiesterase
MISYEIINSGSDGNAVVVEGGILIDCGVAYKAIEPHVPGLQLVLTTHAHFDHFKPSTVHRLAQERPTLRWACGGWMVPKLLGAGVRKTAIDVIAPATANNYQPPLNVSVIAVPLTHDVPNFGWCINLDGKKIFYATDTANLDGISVPGYDLYLVEANHGEQEIRERIARKQATGEYPYEQRAAENHLSEEQALEFIYRNIDSSGRFVLLHQHREEEADGDQQCVPDRADDA